MNLEDVNINKGNPHQDGVGRPAGGALTRVPLDLNTDPSRKRCYLASPAGSDATLLPPARGSKIFSLPSNSSANERLSQLNEKLLYFELPVSANGFFVYNSPPNFLFFPIKMISFPLPCGDLHRAYHRGRP